MTIARRQFVKLTFVVTGAAMTGAAGALASACSSTDEGPQTPNPAGKDAASGADTSAPKADAAGVDAAKDSAGTYACRASISQNHGHTVTVPVTDLDSSTAKTYAIKGTSDHSHDVVLEPQDLSDLKAGLSVKKTSNFAGQTHDHEVNILCATI